MNVKKNLWLVLSLIVLLFASCDDDNNGKDQDNDGSQEPACGEYTRINNMIQGYGYASEDENAVYFAAMDGDVLKLFRQDKKTGVKLVLDTIDKPESGDFAFQFVYVEGDYVYYMPFDLGDPDNRKYRIWRVKKDGSEKEKLFEREDIYNYYIQNNRIYYRMFGDGLYSCALDGSDQKLFLDVEGDSFYFYNGRVYYISYQEYPNIRLRSCKEDGTDKQTLFEETINFRFIIGDDGKIYVAHADEGGTEWMITSMNADGSDQQTLIQNLPSVSCVNLYDGQLFVCFTDNAKYNAGLCKCVDGELVPIVTEGVVSFCMLDGGKIVYMNMADKSNGRLGSPYETDINGSFHTKL